MMTEMTTFPVVSDSVTETPVENRPLLTSEVLTDEMGRRALSPTLASLGRDFYCKCICDPLIKLKYTVPLSAVKLCLLCLAATIVLICLTMLEIVGAHRQGELQHALKERLRYRNLSQQSTHRHSKPHPHSSASYAITQYGHSLLTKLKIPHLVEQGNKTLHESDINNNNNNNNTSAGNETNYTQQVLKAVGADKIAKNLLSHAEKASNISKEIANHIKDAFT